MKLICTTLLVICFSTLSFAKQSKTDSLYALIKIDKNDTTKVNHLNALGKEYLFVIGDFDKCISLSNEALKLATQLNFKKGIAKAYSKIGVAYTYKGNYNQALKYINLALQKQKELNDKKEISNSYNNIATVYLSQKKINDALQMYLNVLRISREMNYKEGMAKVYNNIGVCYVNTKKYDEGLIGFTNAQKIEMELGNNLNVSTSYGNIGYIYLLQLKYAESLKNLTKTLDMSTKLQNKYNMGMNNLQIGNLYYKQSKDKEALKYYTTAKILLKSINSLDLLCNTYGSLVDVDSVLGNYKEAFANYKLYRLYLDTLANQDNIIKENQVLISQTEFQKNELLLKLKNADKQAIITEQKTTKKINVLSGALFVTICTIGFMLYKGYKRNF